MFTPDRTYQLYEIQVEALIEYQTKGFRSLRQQDSFMGLSDEEIARSLSEAREQLDHSGVLDMVASIEAIFRVDMKARLKGRRRSPVAKQMRSLVRQSARVSLNDIFELWKDNLQAGKGTIGELKRLYGHRHWLAHGRYWVDRSGVDPSVDDVLLAYTNAKQAIRLFQADFPRVTGVPGA